jgi:hypothetical protein
MTPLTRRGLAGRDWARESKQLQGRSKAGPTKWLGIVSEGGPREDWGPLLEKRDQEASRLEAFLSFRPYGSAALRTKRIVNPVGGSTAPGVVGSLQGAWSVEYGSALVLGEKVLFLSSSFCILLVAQRL